MFARILGITLGAVLAVGATMAVNPHGKVADAVRSVTQTEQAKGDTRR